MSIFIAQRPTLGMHELRITRIFAAPRELVYEAFSSPEHVKQWMGPRGFVATVLEQDTRVGGSWRACLHQVGEWNDRTYPDLWLGGIFTEVLAPERLAYTLTWEGQADQPTQETLVTLSLSEIDDDTTRMEFHQALFNSIEGRDDHNQGWNSEFDRLDEFLKALQLTSRVRADPRSPSKQPEKTAAK